MEENENKEKEVAQSAPDWENIAKYQAAELANYIKRNKDAVQNAFNDGRASVLNAFLPVLDALGDGVKTIKDASDKEGVEIILRKFEKILLDVGFEEIPCKKGDEFDPYIHTCISNNGDADTKITKVWQKGYRFNGRVVRPATVSI